MILAEVKGQEVARDASHSERSSGLWIVEIVVLDILIGGVALMTETS